MMNILALDPATKTGWAHSNGESGVWDFKTKKDEGPGVKFMKFRSNLCKLLAKAHIDFIAYEAPRGFGHHNALVMHSKWCGVIEEFCAENLNGIGEEIQCKGYVATQIKKHATLDGHASKQDMIDRAEFAFKIPIIDDNHADALWLLDLVKKEFKE